ncbi:MAG TPA: protein kinase [Steroidobacteraceae bacterium]
MSKIPASTEFRQPNVAAVAARSTTLCLIVHDDLELRLRLASLVRRATPKLDADSVTRSALDDMSVERIRSYVAVLFIIEFSLPGEADPLARLAHLRDLAPRLPVFVFARGGDERSAARAMKLGATDYWPIHSVIISELTSALQPLFEATRVESAATSKAFDRWRQPEVAGYRLMKKIAQSDTAAVYLASNEELAQPVALKVQAIKGQPVTGRAAAGRHVEGPPVQGQRIVSDADRLCFTRECEILSKMNHRSIANVLDYGITDDYLFLALEYFPCGSLRDRLKNPVSESDAVNYARQIGEALQIVHAAHIVHRDLKPSNLMLTDDNRVVLIDFGSARTQLVPRDLAEADPCTGTPYYVCPEQIDGRDPDARGDLYSLGVVLFEMLAGALPFNGDTLSEIFAQHRSAPIPRLAERSRCYQPIVDRLLAKNPNDRYASAALFLDELAASGNSTGEKRSKSQGALDS